MTTRWQSNRGMLLAAVLLVALVLMAPGCQEEAYEVTVYKGLSVSAEAYDVAMKSAVSLANDGLITSEQMDGVMAAGETYRVAYLSCVRLLEAYHISGGAPDQDPLTTAITAYSTAMADLLNLVAAYRQPHPGGE